MRWEAACLRLLCEDSADSRGVASPFVALRIRFGHSGTVPEILCPKISLKQGILGCYRGFLDNGNDPGGRIVQELIDFVDIFSLEPLPIIQITVSIVMVCPWEPKFWTKSLREG